MRDVGEVVKILIEYAEIGPSTTMIKKCQAANVSIADAYTLGWSAGLLAVVQILKGDPIPFEERSPGQRKKSRS